MSHFESRRTFWVLSGKLEHDLIAWPPRWYQNDRTINVRWHGMSTGFESWRTFRRPAPQQISISVVFSASVYGHHTRFVTRLMYQIPLIWCTIIIQEQGHNCFVSGTPGILSCSSSSFSWRRQQAATAANHLCHSHSLFWIAAVTFLRRVLPKANQMGHVGFYVFWYTRPQGFLGTFLRHRTLPIRRSGLSIQASQNN